MGGESRVAPTREKWRDQGMSQGRFCSEECRGPEAKASPAIGREPSWLPLTARHSHLRSHLQFHPSGDPAVPSLTVPAPDVSTECAHHGNLILNSGISQLNMFPRWIPPLSNWTTLIQQNCYTINEKINSNSIKKWSNFMWILLFTGKKPYEWIIHRGFFNSVNKKINKIFNSSEVGVFFYCWNNN